MEPNKPATPPAGATPGSGPQNGTNPPVPSPAPTNNGAQGNNEEGKVTITLKEYRNLQRQDARAKSFERRNNLGKGNPSSNVINSDGQGDPELVAELNTEKNLRQEAERKAMQAEVREKTRVILEKPEYANIPKSTKDLILKNPSTLSTADNLEEALIDIEDFLIDQAGSSTPLPTQPVVRPAGHEAPPVSPGGPSPSRAVEPEDVSQKRGPEKTRGMIRNILKNPPKSA